MTTPLNPADLEIKVIHDEFKLVGDYADGRGFIDPDLNALLKHYCEVDGVDVTKTDSSGLPLWLSTWQTKVPQADTWDAGCQGRAGVAEAYLRWYFRGQCKKQNVAYAEASDEFFAELFKSTVNGRAEDFAKGATWEPQSPPSVTSQTAKPPDAHEVAPTFDATNALPLDGTDGSGNAPSAAGATATPNNAAPAAVSGGSSNVLLIPPPPRTELERRMRAAWHSARIEIARGVAKYGEGKWTTGPNTGPIIDQYQKAAYSTPGPGAPWCGIFQAWNYRKAGIKADEKIDKKFQYTGVAGKRVMVFWSTYRLQFYWDAAKSQNLRFPREKIGTWKRDDCVKWLKANLNSYKPLPGDLLVVDTHKPMSHVAMVGGYDPDTFTLVTYEGNFGDKASAHQWDLSAPTRQGFFRMNYIGRMLESDFGDPGEVQPEGPSPDPKIHGPSSATGRYGG